MRTRPQSDSIALTKEKTGTECPREGHCLGFARAIYRERAEPDVPRDPAAISPAQ
jgi:hypothetical protein